MTAEGSAPALETPVAMVVFNRPDTTLQVFEAVRAARPRELLVVADGPRATRPGDRELCEATRAIFDRVDWDCHVRREFSDTNLRSRGRVSTGLDWVFSQVDRAIILEDDCVPDPSFFPFVEEVLNRFIDDQRVMAVGGTNVLGTWRPERESYFFSELGCIWGWATWRRAWRHFDVNLTAWSRPDARRALLGALRRIGPCEVREDQYQKVVDGKIDAWDYQWDACRLLQSGLCVLPTRNLVSNIGCGHPEATNTVEADSPYARLHSHAMRFPLQHPSHVLADHEFDRLILKKQEGPRRIWRHLPESMKAPVRPLWHWLRRSWRSRSRTT